MINLSVRKLRPGMVAAQSIYNRDGGCYLARGMEMSRQYISRLHSLGIHSVAVNSLLPEAGHVPLPEDIVSEKTRMAAVEKVAKTFDSIKETGTLNLKPLSEVSHRLVDEMLASPCNLVQLTDIRAHDDYTFAHSVNVAVLSGMLGSLKHLSASTLQTLVLGGLLHDIGKVAVPVEILNKPGRLTSTEMSVIRMHPIVGRERLCVLKYPAALELSLIAAQHHEHLDGHGYPYHLTGDHIHPYAKIVAIADVYDALTSQRSYKPAYRPHIARKLMGKCSDGQFDQQLLNLFFNNVALYPTGTVLRTKLGYAIVRESAFGKTLTPTVAVFADNDGNVLEKPFEVNLENRPSDTIVSVVEDFELVPLIYRMQVDPAQFL